MQLVKKGQLASRKRKKKLSKTFFEKAEEIRCGNAVCTAGRPTRCTTGRTSAARCKIRPPKDYHARLRREEKCLSPAPGEPRFGRRAPEKPRRRRATPRPERSPHLLEVGEQT